MAIANFAKTTLFLACIFATIVATTSADAQVDLDGEVEKMAERDGFTKELEAKRKMWSQLQVDPSKIELKKLGGGKVALAPYCTIELGDKTSQTEWMVNKTPPMFIATIKNTGTIIFSILPAQGPEVTNEVLYDAMVEKFRGKMERLDATEFHQLSKTEGEGTLSGQHANGNKFKLYLHFVNRRNFILMVQGFGKTPQDTQGIKRIVNTVNFDLPTTKVASTSIDSQASVPYGKSRLIVPNPRGLVRGTDDLPMMVAEMNRQTGLKVNEVFVLPSATQASWQLKGLYRNADARTLGPMTYLGFNLVRQELETAVKQRLSITPQVKLTGIVEFDDPDVIGCTQRVQIPNKTRIGVSAMWFHDGQLFQFCVHSDIRTAADEAWAKATIKDWIRSIREANLNNKIASK